MKCNKLIGFLLIVSCLIILDGYGSERLIAQDDSGAVIALLKQRSVTIRPLEAVTKSSAQILDLNSSSARLNFVGTVHLACTVVFGTSVQFGSAAIDLNMNGGAIIEHNPILRNLTPDTLYYYRLQGSAQDGTLYVSEISTFRTPPKTTQASQNLLSSANGALVIGVSSNFGGQPNDGSWGILNAFDGDPNTAWASNGDGDKAWFAVRLAQRSHISQIEFWSRVMTDKTSEIFEFTVTADDGIVYGPFTVPDADRAYSFSVNFDTSTMRFDVVKSSGGNTGAREVAAYGSSVTK